MKRFKTHLTLAAVFVGLAIAGTMTKPHSTSAKSSSSSAVQFVPNVPFGETGSGGFGLPTAVAVPAGQTLVVETLSLSLDVTPSGSQLAAFVNYTSGGKSITVFVPLTFSYTQTSNGFDTYSATQAVRLYADPGTSHYEAHTGNLYQASIATLRSDNQCEKSRETGSPKNSESNRFNVSLGKTQAQTVNQTAESFRRVQLVKPSPRPLSDASTAIWLLFLAALYLSQNSLGRPKVPRQPRNPSNA